MKKSYNLSFALTTGLFFLFLPILIHLISYLHPIVLAVVFFCLYILVLFSTLLLRNETLHLSTSLFLGIMIFYSVALFILLFFRSNNLEYYSMNLIPFSTINFYLSGRVNSFISFYNLTANIGLFIPYGIFFMVFLKRSPFKLIILPIFFISLIEILQHMTRRGSLDIDDLILNLLGVSIGYLFYPVFKKVMIFK
jgi:glycopeptide antibiotics resistance protein